MKTVGKQLEEGRLEKKWTPEMAARETKIRVDRLLDLESDNFSNFSNPTYARGFVRTYARALNLDEYRLLRQLDQKLPEWDGTLMSETGVVYMTQSPDIPPQQPRGNKLGGLLLWGLCLVSCVVIGVVLYANYVNSSERNSSETNTNTNSPQVTDTPVVTPPPAPVAVAVNPSDLHPAPVAPPVASAAGVDTNNIPVAPVATPIPDPTQPPVVQTVSPAPVPTSNGPIDPNSIPVAPAVSADATPTPTASVPTAIAGTNTATPSDAPVAAKAIAVDPAELAQMNIALNTTPTPVATPAPKSLTLTAHGDCYVTVKEVDSHDRAQLIYKNEIHAGDSVDFDGKKFRIKLSDPALVDVSVLGNSYSHHTDHDEEIFDVNVHP